VYTLCEDGAAEDEGEGGDDAVPSFREWELPSAAFHRVRGRRQHRHIALHATLYSHDDLTHTLSSGDWSLQTN